MSLRDWIVKLFWEAIALDIKFPSDLKQSLKNNGHPNLEKFFDSMVVQINDAEKQLALIGLPRLKPETITQTVFCMAEAFLTGMQGEKNLQTESEFKKLEREREADKIKVFDEVLKGNNVDEFKEAGLITSDAIDSQREKTLEQNA